MASKRRHPELLNVVKNRHLMSAVRTQKQNAVFKHLLRNSSCISSPNFRSISAEDLGMLFHAIDEHFFDGQISPACERACDRPLSFRLSTRMTSVGGMTTMTGSTRGKEKPQFEIAIASTPLFETFKLDATGVVGGLRCDSRLEALQRIMEHEIIHLIEMLLTGDSNCSANPFREIVKRFFGHLESNHQLLTPKDVAKRKMGISPGDQVSFVHDDHQQIGFVNRISKRATVLVESPKGTPYSDGKRYQKFYVPLHRLKRHSA